METFYWLGWAFPIWVVIAVVITIAYMKTHTPPSPDELLILQHGPLNPALICPHCQEKGRVRTKSEVQKMGISGTKVMAGMVTGGVSLLGTGLSRKQAFTEAYCENCNSTWHF